MAKKKPIIIIEKGSMKLESKRGKSVEFSLIGTKRLLSKRDRVFIADRFPEDFDHDKYDVTGTYHYTITIRKK